MDWQPISDAPKDGTIIRLFNPEWVMDGWPNDMTGRWETDHWKAVPALGMTLGKSREIDDPTYWKPRNAE